MRRSLWEQVGVPFDHPFTRADLEAIGYPWAALRYWLGNGEVERISRGVFAVTSVALPVTKPMLSGSQLAPLEVAAELHGLAVPPGLPPIASRPLRRDRIPAEQVVWLRGVLVPSVALTAVHLARFQPVPHALIPLDSALNRGATLAQLRAEVSGLAGRRGTLLLEQALALADGASESALESLARGAMWAAAAADCGSRRHGQVLTPRGPVGREVKALRTAGSGLRRPAMHLVGCGRAEYALRQRARPTAGAPTAVSR